MSNIFNIETKHVALTQPLEEYVKRKLSKVEKMVHKVTSVRVILTIEKLVQKAEAEIRIGGDQKSIFAEAVSEDMYKSIDALEDRLVKQVVKYKEEIESHRGF